MIEAFFKILEVILGGFGMVCAVAAMISLVCFMVIAIFGAFYLLDDMWKGY